MKERKLLFVDKDFVLQDIVASYAELRYRLCFRSCGTLSITLNDSETAGAFHAGDFVLIDGRAYIVENIHCYYEDGGNKFEITGHDLRILLKRRVVPSFVFNTADTIESQFEKLINENFISPTDPKRKIKEFSFRRTDSTKKAGIEALFENTNCLDIVEKMCCDYDLGFDVVYNADKKRFTFMLLEGNDKHNDVIFSDKNRNIANKDIYQQTQDYLNVGYLNNEGVLTSIGSAEGIDRREFISTGDDASVIYQTIAESQPLLGATFDTIDTELYAYERDYQLGDIVTFEDHELNLKAERRLLEIEFFITDTETRTPTFGDSIPTIFDKLKKGAR